MKIQIQVLVLLALASPANAEEEGIGAQNRAALTIGVTDTKQETFARGGFDARIMGQIPIADAKLGTVPVRAGAEVGFDGGVGVPIGVSIDPGFNATLARAGLTAQLKGIMDVDFLNWALKIGSGSSGVELVPTRFRMKGTQGPVTVCLNATPISVLAGSNRMAGAESPVRYSARTEACVAVDLPGKLGEIRATGQIGLASLKSTAIPGIPDALEIGAGGGIEWRAIADTPVYAGYRFDHRDISGYLPSLREVSTNTHTLAVGIRGL